MRNRINNGKKGTRILIRNLEGKLAGEITDILQKHVDSAKTSVSIDGVVFGSKEYCTEIHIINHEPADSTKTYSYTKLRHEQPDISISILYGCSDESKAGIAEVNSFTDVSMIFVK